MHILSLETSTNNFSLAVVKDEKILRIKNLKTKRILEEAITKSIDQLLNACQLSINKIDLIAVGLGPGSFTSLRVGLSTVKAFVLALNIPVVGVCSLDIIAAGVDEKGIDEICVITDARRGKVYAAIYDQQLTCKTEYLLTTIEDVLTKVRGKTLFVGDGLMLYKDKIELAYKDYHISSAVEGKTKGKVASCLALFAKEKFWYPKASLLAKLAFDRYDPKRNTKIERLLPIYLYPQDCQVDKK